MAQITKLALKSALIELLEEEPLDKITIKDIVCKCDLNRNTFYYHFQDIYGLIDFLFISEANELMNVEKMYEHWQDNFLKLTNYLITHKKMIYHIYYSLNREQLETYLYGIVNHLLLQVVSERSTYSLEKEHLQTIIDFYKYAFVGMILQWVKNGMEEDPQVMVKRIELVFEPSLQVLLVDRQKP